jgi:hypothetical protein
VGSLLRWVIAQVVGLHDARDLCLVTAVAPMKGDRWTWVASAPHARPNTPPLSGPHTTTNAEGAADLAARLRDLVEVRRVAASDGPAYHALAVLPRVLAVLDDRLDPPDADYLAAVGPQLGVHVLRLLRPGVRPPASCGVCVDVDAAGRELVIRLAGRPAESRRGVPDGVPVRYARDLAELLDE